MKTPKLFRKIALVTNEEARELLGFGTLQQLYQYVAKFGPAGKRRIRKYYEAGISGPHTTFALYAEDVDVHVELLS